MKPESFRICKWCDEVIAPGEHIVEMIDGEAVHRECGFRAVAGGANHHLRLCSCCGGTEPVDPPGMTKREAAIWSLRVYRWVRALQEVIRLTGEE